MSTIKKTPGPDYYALADGRKLVELCRDEIAPLCTRSGMSAWDIHCLISAMEHKFRMGAKPGEEDTDQEAFGWWIAQMSWSGISMPTAAEVIGRVDSERRKVGR